MPSVFLSHSREDRETARRIANDLEKEGIYVWLDEWEILVGDSITQRVQQGLDQVDFVAVLLTAHSLESGWVEKEWQSQIGLEAERKQIRVLPVKGDASEIPLLLRDKRYADLGPDYLSGLSDLLRAIHGHSSRHSEKTPESPRPVPRVSRTDRGSSARRRRYVYMTLAFAMLVFATIVIYLFAGRVSKRQYEFDNDKPEAVVAKSSHIVTPTESYKIHDLLQLPTPDYSNFELLEDRRVIDLRDWKPFEKGALGRLSPVTWSRLVKLRKIKPAEWVRFAFATEGAGIDAECSSGQDYYLETGTIASTPPQLLMKAFHVVVNVAKYKVGEPFELEFQATFWNGTAEHEDWTAYKVYGPVAVCSMLILFPEKKPFLWKKSVMYRSESLQELVPPAEQGGLIYDPNRRVLYWEIKNPTLDNTYEIQWGW